MEGLAHLGLMLSRLLLMVQVVGLHGQFLDLSPLHDHSSVPPKVGIGWCYIADFREVATVVVMIDESIGLIFQITQ